MTSTTEPVPDRIDQQQLAQQLVEAARVDAGEPATAAIPPWLWELLDAAEFLGADPGGRCNAGRTRPVRRRGGVVR